MNDKLLELWDKHKKDGMVVYSNRQSGKTTSVINLALRESSLGNPVEIWTMSEEHKKMIIELIRRKDWPHFPRGIHVYNTQNTSDKIKSKKIETTFSFYDEVIQEKSPNSLIIRSFNPSDGIFIFNIENTKSQVTIKHLKELKKQLTEEQWRAEFMSGFVE